MNTELKDKTLSTIFLLLSVALIVFALGNANIGQSIPTHNMFDFMYYLIDHYLDILLVSYIFICLQISGFVELKYKQNFITISLVSIFLTPFALFFIVSNDQK